MNDKILQAVKNVFDIAIEYAILLIELIGVFVLLYAVARALTELIRKRELTRLHLAEGIALSLEFKVGAELLHTVTVRELDDLYVLAAVILLRAALTFLIHWEIKLERKNDLAIKEIEKKEE